MKLRRIISWCSQIASKLSGIILSITMITIVIDLSGRFFFNSPLAGGVELVRTFLVMIVFFGLAYTQLKDEHIRMDLLLNYSSRNVKCALEIFGLSIALLVYAFITYATIPVMIQSVVRGEYETGLIPFPMWPARIFMCIGLFLIVFQLMSDLILKLSSIKDLHVAVEENGLEEKWNKF